MTIAFDASCQPSIGQRHIATVGLPTKFVNGFRVISFYPTFIDFIETEPQRSGIGSSIRATAMRTTRADDPFIPPSPHSRASSPRFPRPEYQRSRSSRATVLQQDHSSFQGGGKNFNFRRFRRFRRVTTLGDFATHHPTIETTGIEIMQDRGLFSSRLGFILTAGGSAVGLGNIWKFPYLAGSNGGAAFLIIYLAIVFSLGLSVMLAEFTIGRAAAKSAVGAYRDLRGGPWPVAGFLAVLAGFTVLCFYSVVGGWTLTYLAEAVRGGLPSDKDALGAFFGSTISDPLVPIIAHGLFMALTAGIVYAGVGKGIERCNKVLMPLLFLLLIVLAIRAVTLDGASAGIAFFLEPDFSKVTAETVNAALGQAFFTLSLGAGTMIAYGSYFDRREDLPKAAMMVTGLDTLVALLAGFIILPAVFAFGFSPGAGPGLTFITLPAIFAAMPLGGIFATAFFLLLAIAALTSAVSVLEAVVAHLIDEHGHGRRQSTILSAAVIFALGIPASLSFGPWSDTMVGGKTIFDLMDYFASNLLLPIGGILISLFVGWSIKPRAVDEVHEGRDNPFRLTPIWIAILRYVAPLAIAWILISGI